MAGDDVKLTAVAAWRARMRLSQRAAATALGMTLKGYQEQERGAGFDGSPRVACMRMLLACAAIEAGLAPISDPTNGIDLHA